SFIFWDDQSWKKNCYCQALSVFNYESFSQIMIPTSKPTSHCSNILSKSQPVKWPLIFWEDQQRSQRIQTDIASSKAMFLNKTPAFANGSTRFLVLYLIKSRSKKTPLKHLDWNPKEDPDGFTFHLSFTIIKSSNKTQKDNDAPPFTFFMWIPIKQTTGNFVEEIFEVKGVRILT
ncbi:hypothetical protein VP01_5640g1, partial [Puccinia sorghi]